MFLDRNVPHSWSLLLNSNKHNLMTDSFNIRFTNTEIQQNTGNGDIDILKFQALKVPYPHKQL